MSGNLGKKGLDVKEERINEAEGNPAEKEFIEHIWMEVTEVRDMLVISRKGMEDEKDLEAVRSVLHIAEKLLENIMEKIDRFLT